MSSLTRLYWSLPTPAQNALLTLYGLRLRWLRYGGLHDQVLEELLQSQWWTAEQHREAQLVRLNALLFNASQRSNFYRYRGYPPQLSSLEHLEALPVLRRSEVRGESAEMSVLRPGTRGLQEISTGGTTGTPLTVYCDREALQRNYAFFSRLKRWAGLPVRCHTATFAGRTIVPPEARQEFWRKNLAMRTLLCSSYHLSADHLEAYVEALERFDPELIDSYPSSIEPIARHILARAGARVRPKAVITSSETLWPEVAAVIRQAFECPVFDHYGSAEMAAFVSQCEHGSYHVNPEFGIVEILRDDGRPAAPGETGEIVATGFVNQVMPLIRYATGDRAIQGPTAPCACGRAFPRLERIEGRMDDVIQTPSGRRIGRLDPIFKSVRTISEARIVQHARDRVRLEYVTTQEPKPAELTILASELHERLGREMAVEVVRVAAIERTGAGKLRTVLNEYARRRTPVPDHVGRFDVGRALADDGRSELATRREVEPTQVSVSVIVPVRDGMPELEPCLESVLQAVRHHGHAELIVVDNGSTDASLATIRRIVGDEARLVTRPDATISAVRNAGAAVSQGEVLVFIDSDCVVGRGHLSLVQEYLDGSDVAATGRRVGLPERATWVERCWHDLHDRPAAAVTAHINSGNFAVRREAFATVGGFDEQLVTGEDAELCQRLRRRGYKLHELDSLRVQHLRNAKTVPAFFAKERWRALGMFGTFDFKELDRPTFMLFLHIALLLAAVVQLATQWASLAWRLGVAAGLVTIVPVLSVAYRLLRSRNARCTLGGVVLYHVYFAARMAALFDIAAGRARPPVASEREA